MIGEEVGSYRITEFIAKGEVSFLYKAYEPSKKKYFAVKVFTLSRTRDHNMVRNFLHEAEIMASLEHDHILPIYDLGRQDGIYYIVTRYVNASPLSQIMDEFRQPRHVITLLRPLANALEYLHQKNVIHANVKPNNILVDGSTRPYLTSIGFAARLGGATTYGAYAAPEQALGVIDRTVDVYALGVLLYELMAGELPSTIGRSNLRRIRPDIPGTLNDVLLKAMDPEPEKRFQSCLDFSDSLVAAVFPGNTPLIASDSYPTAVEIADAEKLSNRVSKQKKRKNVRLALIIAALFLVIASSIYLLSSVISSEGNSSRTNVTQVSVVNDANVRAGPGIEYPVIGFLRQGESTIATSTNQNSDWFGIYYSSDLDGQAWISARMVEPEDLKNLPIIDYSEDDIQVGVESATNKLLIEDTVQERSEIEAEEIREDPSSELSAGSEQESGWSPNSICGLPAVILLLTLVVPFGKGMQSRSQKT
jgi:serine/threonine protein kinase